MDIILDCGGMRWLFIYLVMFYEPNYLKENQQWKEKVSKTFVIPCI